MHVWGVILFITFCLVAVRGQAEAIAAVASSPGTQSAASGLISEIADKLKFKYERQVGEVQQGVGFKKFGSMQNTGSLHGIATLQKAKEMLARRIQSHNLQQLPENVQVILSDFAEIPDHRETAVNTEFATPDGKGVALGFHLRESEKYKGKWDLDYVLTSLTYTPAPNYRVITTTTSGWFWGTSTQHIEELPVALDQGTLKKLTGMLMMSQSIAQQNAAGAIGQGEL